MGRSSNFKKEVLTKNKNYARSRNQNKVQYRLDKSN